MFVSVNETEKQNRENHFKFSTGMEKNKLFVRGLPKTKAKEDLEELFGEFGKLQDVRVVTFRNGHSKGIAYIDYVTASDANKAVLKLDNHVIEGQTITVAISQPPVRKQQESVTVSKSLGGGSGQPLGPRGKGRSQIAFVPASVAKKTSTPATSSSSASNGSSTSNSSNGSSKGMSNEEFRKLF